MPLAIHRAGWLNRFLTDFFFGRRPRLDGLLSRLLPWAGIKDIATRRTSELPISLVRDYPELELVTRIRKFRSDSERWMHVGKMFAKRSSGFWTPQIKLGYAFSSAALEFFNRGEQLGGFKVLDHATAPRNLEMEYVFEEEQIFAGWNLAETRKDPFLQQYSDRQAEEREKANLVLVGSQYVKRLIECDGRGISDVHVMPLGFSHKVLREVVRETRPDSQQLNILFVGGEGLRKGLGYVARALKLLNTSSMNFRVVGNPGFSQHGIQELSKFANCIGTVPRAEISKHYLWADVLVLPTLSDTFGLVILEAMSHGLPVVTTPNSSGPEIIRDGVDGWIVPIRDHVAIASKLELLLKDSALRFEMSQRAFERASVFSVENYQRTLIGLISDCYQRFKIDH